MRREEKTAILQKPKTSLSGFLRKNSLLKEELNQTYQIHGIVFYRKEALTIEK